MAERPYVTIFGSSRPLPEEPLYALAEELGFRLAQAGYNVCNGGYGGVMEASARGCRRGGGRSLGVPLAGVGAPNAYLDALAPAADLFERLRRLVEIGSAYVVLPGGTGTLVEVALVWELAYKGWGMRKPIWVWAPFWEPLIRLIDAEPGLETRAQGMRPSSLLKPVGSIDEILSELSALRLH
ncbi:MAG: LOG family protein [Bacteroidetes bacterium]|nr:LOG family protein [Bacteroidota bacterium]